MQNTRISTFFISIFKRNIIFLFIALVSNIQAQNIIPFEKSKGTATATLEECLLFYNNLAASNKGFMKIENPSLNAEELKYHDAGQIKLICITNFNVKKEKVRVFINNGIHPGEPDGVDACMLLARDFLTKNELKKLLDDVELYIIPIYNTGGALHRGCCSRANQDGPVEYGFRGNALNLDLNRDFIKCDALETEVLESYFHKVKPHFFIDTHVSDGADYQYTMTLIASQHNKLQNEAIENFQQKILLPLIFQKMKSANEEMIPYVDFDKDVPDSGLTAFFDTPRFSSGYASLFNCFSFMAETHMLKPFDKRVKATYALLLEMIRIASEKKAEILNTMAEAEKILKTQNKIGLKWSLDTVHYEMINFNGYTSYYATSPVTNLQQLYYNEGGPYSRDIKYFNTYTITQSIDIPKAYVLPYEWYEKLNLQRYHLNIKIVKDTTIKIVAYTKVQFTERKNPYEGNAPATLDYMVRDTLMQKLDGYCVIISLKENLRYQRFLVEALEPQSPDGFFAWGKMYSFVQQKEGFSDYVWDKKAWDILIKDRALNEAFVQMKNYSNPGFAKDKNLQLDFIYRHSPYYETSHLRYPIFRIEN